MIAFAIIAQVYTVARIDLPELKYGLSETEVMAQLRIKVGDQIRYEDIDSAVIRMFSTGLYDDVRIYRTVLGNGQLALRLELDQAPRISGWDFKFVRKIKTKQIEDSLRVHLARGATRYRLFAIKTTVEKMYRDKGYLKAKVELQVLEPDEKGEVKIRIIVDEGEKYKIGRIEIEGNKAFSDHQLAGHFQNKEQNWWRRLFRQGKFNDEKWYEDLANLEKFYKDHGYPKAKVDSFKTEYMKEGLMRLVVYVNEGPRYRFGKVSFEGATVFSDSVLARTAGLTRKRSWAERLKYNLFWRTPYSDEDYNKSRVDMAVANIGGIYADSGYIYVQVVPEEHESDSFMDINFLIKENWRVKVRKIEIAGNTVTHDYVVRRELDLMPGEYFNREKAVKSIRDLYYLNYFEMVDIQFKPVADSEWVDVVFAVKEKPTAQVGAGATYSGIEGFFLNASFSQANFQGKGQQVSFMLDWGSRRQNYSLGFTEPWLFGKPRSFGATIYSLTRYYPYQYNQNSMGGSVAYSQWLWSDLWRISLSYRLEWIKVYNISSAYQGFPLYDFWQERERLLSSSLSAGITYDCRNRIFNAFRGYSVGYTFGLTGGPLGGDVSYTEHTINTSFYKAFLRSEKLVSVLSLRWGSLFGITTGTDVPFYEYYALGDIGPYGLRGYPYRSVGVEVGGNVIGGRHFFIGTFEERYRISEQMYVSVFFDAGQSWWRLNMVDLRELKKGAGVGVRVEVPLLGIIGLDIAYGFDNDGGRWVPHIQFGPGY